MSSGSRQTQIEDGVPRGLLENLPARAWASTGLQPLAWWAACGSGDGIDSDAAASGRAAIANWEIQQHAVLALTRVMSQAGLPVAFLKGTDLNLRCYPQPGLRPMADVDMLVADDDLPRVSEVLTSAGYESRDRPDDPPANIAFERDFHDPRLGVDLDVHTAVDWQESLGVTTEELLARRVVHEASGVPLLSGPDLLMNLATHALRDFSEAATLAIVDAHYVLEALDLPWDEILERAQAWRARPALRLLLERLRRFGGEEIPDRVLRSLETGWLTRRVVGWLASSLEGPPALSRDWVERMARFGMIESTGSRARLAIRYAGLRLGIGGGARGGGNLAKWRAATPAQRRLFVEAWGELLRVALELRTPFGRTVIDRALRTPAGSRCPPLSPTLAWAVRTAANHHLRPMLCLEQSLASWRMLRRRHADVRLKIGVRREGIDLDAHAWLEGAAAPPDSRQEDYASLEADPPEDGLTA